MEKISVVTPDTVTLNITTSSSSFLSEKRFPKNITILEFKMKLELISGCQAGTMKLELFSADDSFVTEISDNDALLGSFNIDNGMRIHVSDPNVVLGQYEDVSKVKKFELTDDEYAAKSESLRAYKERHKLGRFKILTDEERAAKDAELEEKTKRDSALIEALKVGDRCRVTVHQQPARLGCIRYVGETSFKDGLWVGIQYDEPVGKNDGSVDGRRYFQCTQNYGGFVKPSAVEAGDFPEDDLGFGDDEM